MLYCVEYKVYAFDQEFNGDIIVQSNNISELVHQIAAMYNSRPDQVDLISIFGFDSNLV